MFRFIKMAGQKRVNAPPPPPNQQQQQARGAPSAERRAKLLEIEKRTERFMLDLEELSAGIDVLRREVGVSAERKKLIDSGIDRRLEALRTGEQRMRNRASKLGEKIAAGLASKE